MRPARLPFPRRVLRGKKFLHEPPRSSENRPKSGGLSVRFKGVWPTQTTTNLRRRGGGPVRRNPRRSRRRGGRSGAGRRGRRWWPRRSSSPTRREAAVAETGFVSNISMNGIGFHTRRPLAVGEELRINLEVGPMKWSSRFRVVSCQPHAKTGTYDVRRGVRRGRPRERDPPVGRGVDRFRRIHFTAAPAEAGGPAGVCGHRCAYARLWVTSRRPPGPRHLSAPPADRAIHITSPGNGTDEKEAGPSRMRDGPAVFIMRGNPPFSRRS